jgi:CRP-like cAMP-binding protein
VASTKSGTVGFVLDLDPDLGAEIPVEEREAARNACRGGVVAVPRGRWTPPADAAERPDLLAMSIVDGLLCREVAIRDRHVLELLGPGDVLHLPIVRQRPSLGSAVKLTAATDLLLVELGESFIRAAAEWPCLLIELHRRLEAQRERLAIQAAIVHLPRAEHRVLLALWHLTDSWGRITPFGRLLPIPLTHDVLGQLTAARRSTVTLALGVLEQQGLIRRMDDGCWLLTNTAEPEVQLIARAGSREGAVGESVMLRRLIGSR